MHLTTDELAAGIDRIREAPAGSGTVELIVRRPCEGEREVIDVATLDTDLGLIGDNWAVRGSRLTDDGGPHPEMQLNVMSSRAISLIAGTPERGPLAGDQLYVDLALDDVNLPTGSRLALGTAIIEVTAVPHNGCAKFAERFGMDAARFVNSPVGKELHLRGITAKVVRSGAVRRGDRISRLGSDTRPEPGSRPTQVRARHQGASTSPSGLRRGRQGASPAPIPGSSVDAMTDVLFLLGTVLAFGVFVLLLRGCEKIVGVEPLPPTTDHPDDQPTPAHATAGDDMSGGNLVGLVLSGLVLVYLLVVLIVPERF